VPLQKLDQLRLAEISKTAALNLKHIDGLVKGEKSLGLFAAGC
jgi:hypothetical protein